MRRLLITGGSGSFGNAMTRHLLDHHLAEQVVILSRDELKQSEMATRFDDDPRLRFFLGDVRDRDRLALAFRSCDVVIHAAALKQVPAGEYNPSEFIRTNILGTENVLLAASAAGVEKTIVLSSDKAAAPVNLYGSTKACAEHLTRAAQHYSHGSLFACLRYGNVAGSRGSVIPAWRADTGGGVVSAVCLTSRECTRFWFTLPKAVRFCLDVLGRMEGGELFVPELPSFRLTDLAVAMFGPDILFKPMPLRPGEKIHESMITADESHYFEAHGLGFVRRYHDLVEGRTFEYRSDTNPDFLTVEQLREELKSV